MCALWMLPPNAERLPRTGEGPEDLWARSVALAATPAEAYLEKRRVALDLAEDAGVRFTPDLNGRPAVLARLTGPQDELRAVHGRHLHDRRGEGKMFTVGRSGGLFTGHGGLAAEPLILVEGLFDALSFSTAFPCVATIGRWVDWLPEAAGGREVWLAFTPTARATAPPASSRRPSPAAVAGGCVPPAGRGTGTPRRARSAP
jgi:hypothetical protein